MRRLDPESYPTLPLLTDERILEYLEATILLLPVSLQSQLHCLLWNIVDSPTYRQLHILKRTPLEPLFYIDKLTAQLYIFRQNLRRYAMIQEHIPSRMAQELKTFLHSQKIMDA